MKKSRHNPDKPQNKYGGDFCCPHYDALASGKEFCHDEGQANLNEFVLWARHDQNGNLECKGNRHVCLKLKRKWLASLSEKERDRQQRRQQ